MQAQGCKVIDNILHQDDKRSMLLEKNGKAPSSKRMKHINIRCFFVTDRIDKGEVSVVWCPAGNMTRDFMMKPLQGALFCKFRDHIVGVVPMQDPGPGKFKEPKVIKNKKTNKKNNVKKKKSQGKASGKLVMHKG